MTPNPEQVPQISDECRAVITGLLEAIPADECTVWLYREEDGALLAVHNPANPDIVGLSQPVSRGLISLVLVTGLPLLEPDVINREEHDPGIDSQLGRVTHALMAAPIYRNADVGGVVSAVQFSDTSRERGFHDEDLASLERAAVEVGRIMATPRTTNPESL